MGSRREFLIGAGSLAAATGSWRGVAPRLFTPETAGLFDAAEPFPAWAEALIEGQLQRWEGAELPVEDMRATNPEWDLMSRTFLVLALANLTLRRPGAEAERYLAVMDTIIEQTLASAIERSMYYFLLPYAGARAWRRRPARSLFVDGEVLAMLAAFEIVAPGRRPLARIETWAARVSEQLRAGPILSAESYPDECWTFCNTTALAGLHMAGVAGVAVDAALVGDWLEQARAQLVHAPTGLLVSSYRWDGTTLDGPEGSSIWMSATNLLLLDAEFAREQYARARAQLGGRFMGFGYAREWPRRARGPMDVDSGPVIPLLDASPGSSGLALLGARAFDDRRYLEELLASLELTAFPQWEQQQGRSVLRYRASNLLGDAVLTYALCFGPLWARAREVAG